jgi:hypothetical protein
VLVERGQHLRLRRTVFHRGERVICK